MTHPPPLILDEVQRAPDLFMSLKLHIDNNGAILKEGLSFNAEIQSFLLVLTSLLFQYSLFGISRYTQITFEVV